MRSRFFPVRFLIKMMMMKYSRFFPLAGSMAILGALSWSGSGRCEEQRGEVQESFTETGIEFREQDKLVLRYHKTKPEDSTCTSPNAAYFHPLTSPSGTVVTDVAPDDHLHHRGVFVSWLEVRSKKGEGDFWGWGKFAELEGRLIEHRESSPTESKEPGFVVRNDWKAGEVVLLEEQLEMTWSREEDCLIYDLHYQFGSEEEVTLGQHAFSGFCVRLRKDWPIQAYDPEGAVTLPPPHHLKPESNWPDRPWYAYEMTRPDGGKLGVAVINHRENPVTTWHNAASIAMINPCIVAPGPVTIPAGKPLPSRYRVVVFEGGIQPDLLNRLADGFSATTE